MLALAPRVLAVLPRVIPSTTISVVKPLTALHREGQIVADIALEYLVSRTQVARADVVVFCRNTEPKYNHALNFARALRKPIIYDLDDNLFDPPPLSDVASYHRSPERLNQLKDYLQAASLVRVYSEHLKQRIAEINACVRRVDGPLDWDLVPAPMPMRGSGEKVRIVYATSRIADALANIFLDDVERLLAAYDGCVELFLWGYRSRRLAGHPSVRFLNYVANYDHFFHKFARYGFDIGLAPLLNDDFHLAKSNNKFREYAACRIAGVYSNVPVYSACVEHEVTGLLVPNQAGAWFEALTRLIEDVELRRRIQEHAQQYARQHYDQNKFCQVWLEHLQSVLAKRAGAQPVPLDAARSVTESAPRTEKTRWAERVEQLLKITSRLAQLTGRFVVSIKVRGARETLHQLRWTLNDLSFIFWERRGR